MKIIQLQDPSRREFLKRGAAVLGTIGLSSLSSGCQLLTNAPPNRSDDDQFYDDQLDDDQLDDDQFDDDQLGDDLDQFIQAKMQMGKMPGLAACIVKGNQIVWSKGYGWANVEKQLPVTPDTLFLLASVSKAVTAVSLLQLYDDGLFDLDDDLNNYLPFPVRNPHHPDTVITPRMILSHSSGIWDNWDILEPLVVSGDSTVPLDNFCRNYLTPNGKYYDANENFDTQMPGTIYEYSNVGATLCGYLAESISGKLFSQHSQERLFAPLGMDETSWHLANLNVDHIAVPYQVEANEYSPLAHYGFPDYPNGSLRSSINQLARFLIAIINEGDYNGTRILTPETVAEIGEVQFPQLDSQQGLIWYHEDGLLGHEGGEEGALTRLFFQPDTGVGVILLTNSSPENEAAFYDIEARLYQEGLNSI